MQQLARGVSCSFFYRVRGVLLVGFSGLETDTEWNNDEFTGFTDSLIPAESKGSGKGSEQSSEGAQVEVAERVAGIPKEIF